MHVKFKSQILFQDENGKGLTDKEIRDEVNTFMFAGHDTIATGIATDICMYICIN